MSAERVAVAPCCLLLCLTLATCVKEPSGPRSPRLQAADVAAAAATGTLLAAGDIAKCTSSGDDSTAKILDTIPGTVLILGDNAFPKGTLADYQNCYGPTWGRQKDRTFATLGNHEYDAGTADGTFDYFGEAQAGPRGKGYYSFDTGGWHIIVLNSNVSHVPASAGSEQDLWLQADLAAQAARPDPPLCTLAAVHQPRFFSSNVVDFTSSTLVKNLWQRLYNAGAEVVLSAQEHDYERLTPMTPDGAVDNVNGIRQFEVGTGGESVSLPTFMAANSEKIAADFGVLKLTLFPDHYTWQFIPAGGETFTDEGSGTCHGAPGSPPPTNHAPTAAAGGPYTGTEGQAVSPPFDGSASSDPDGDALTYSWSFGDNSTGSGARPTHSYADNRSYTVTLTVTDTHGASSAATTTATIANAPPTVDAGPSQTIGPLATYTLRATFHDPGVADAPWSYTIDWGDGTDLLPDRTTGSTSNQADPITAEHTYLLPGTHTVRVTVTDKDGGSGSDSTTVTVQLLSQTISFDFAASGSYTFGDPPFGVSATASSGLPVSYSVGSGSNCTIAGSTVTILGAGTCPVTATQPGNGTYAPAPPVTQTFPIAKATPLVAWNSPLSSLLYGDTVKATQLDALATGVLGVRLAGTFTYTPGPGTVMLQPGMQTLFVTFLPADAANYRTASASVPITVVYNTAVGHALLPPIGRPQQDTAVIQLGSNVAVKFQLFFPDGKTRVATALGTIRVIRMATATSGLADEPVVAAAPSQGTTIRNVGDRYLFNLSTDNWTAGLHQIIVTLDDGSPIAGFVVVKSR